MTVLPIQKNKIEGCSKEGFVEDFRVRRKKNAHTENLKWYQSKIYNTG